MVIVKVSVIRNVTPRLPVRTLLMTVIRLTVIVVTWVISILRLASIPLCPTMPVHMLRVKDVSVATANFVIIVRTAVKVIVETKLSSRALLSLQVSSGVVEPVLFGVVPTMLVLISVVVLKLSIRSNRQNRLTRSTV